MPELPEVETIVRDIRPSLVGRRIDRVTLSHDDVLRGVTRRRLVRRLKGATIKGVSRRAKHAVLELDSGRLVIQPGMTGSLMVHRRPLEAEELRDHTWVLVEGYDPHRWGRAGKPWEEA